jgi:hypothetical protein
MRRLVLLPALTVAALLVCTPASAAPDFTFAVLPAGGAVAGPAGSTVGWGYDITNPSATDWLELLSVNADPFVNGTPLNIFDLPILAPLATRTVPYDGINGLYELTWDAGAPAGFVNSGVFVLTAQFWDGDPLAGGTLIGPANDQSDDYAATVTGGVAPEPATMLLVGSGLIAFARRRARAARR